MIRFTFIALLFYTFIGYGQQYVVKPSLSSNYYLKILANSKDSLYKSMVATYENQLQKEPQNYLLAIEKCKLIGNAYNGEYDEYNPKEDDFQVCLENLAEIYPGEPEVLIYISETKYGNDAVEFLKGLLSKSEEKPDKWTGRTWQVYNLLAEQYGYLDSSKLAIKYGKMALELNDTLDLQLLLAKQYHELSMNKEAIKVLESAIDSTDKSYVLTQKATLLLELGKPKEALKLFQYARRDTNAYIDNGTVAKAFVENKMYSEARPYFVKDINASNWQPTEAYLQLFEFDLKYGLKDSLNATYRKMTEANFFSDPVGRDRIALFLASPLEAWTLSDLFRVSLLFACLLLLLIAPYLWILPIHYAGIYFNSQGHILNQETYRWGLKHMWTACFFIVTIDILAALIFEYNNFILEVLNDQYQPETLITVESANVMIFFTLVLTAISFIYIRKEDLKFIWGDRITKKKAVGTGILCAFVLLTFMGIYKRFSGVFNTPAVFAINDNILSINKFYHPLLGFFLTVILVPLYEELFFRGIFLSAVKKHLHFAWAIMIQAIFFALMHADYTLFPFYLFFGTVAGYLSHRYHALAPGMIMHITNNLIAFISISVLYDKGIY